MVDSDDLSLLLRDWGVAPQSDVDGYTVGAAMDSDELSYLLANWGYDHASASPQAGGGASLEAGAGDTTVVPEPTTLILLGLAGLGVLMRRRGR